MSSITTWTRLEPQSRDSEMKTSLQAKVYDPLWLLTRQWQLGEFEGQDNGSPIVARWRAEGARLTRYQAGAIGPGGSSNAQSYDCSRSPLETLVERERIRHSTGQTPDQTPKPEKLRLAAESGQQFLRMLNQPELNQPPLSRDYRDAFTGQYGFPALTPEQRAALDGNSLGFFDLIATRVPDGRRLYAAFRSAVGTSGIVFSPALQIAAADVAGVERIARLWLQSVETLFSEPEISSANASGSQTGNTSASNPSWSPERLEYSFSVGARFGDGERVLTASEYSEGHLDWYAFDSPNVDAGITLGSPTENAFSEVTRTAIPAPVSFRGMPAPRFWEFEDAQVDFGAVDAGATDLARMLLVEFALSYGNDWFVIPIEVDVGCLYRTRSLVITDTFGVRTLIKPSSQSASQSASWRMFQLSNLRPDGAPGTGMTSNLFFLPPALLKSLENQPIEEVLFLRDEMANRAWAIERVIESPSGHPLNRFEAYLEQKRRAERESTSQPATSGSTTPASASTIAAGVMGSDTLRYRLTTEIPDYWVPLLPVRTGQGLRLKRGAMLNTDGLPRTVEARGSILESGGQLSLFEEEVPREGIRVTRSYQFTRWIDGSSHCWIGRRKRIGSGEGSSGLRFDSLGGND